MPFAVVKTDPTFEKIVLMAGAMLGTTAPAATATNPAISAYSIKSCAWLSFQILSLKRTSVIRFIKRASTLVHALDMEPKNYNL